MENLFNFELIDQHYEIISTNDVQTSLNEVIIPSSYNDLPVLKVQKGALKTLPNDVKSIIFQDGIEELYFEDLPTNLVKLELPNSIVIVEKSLVILDKLKELIVPCYKAFDNIFFLIFASNLEKLVIKAGSKIPQIFSFNKASEICLNENVEEILNYAFSDCKNLSKINLPDGLKSIHSYAFKNCDSLHSITIPRTVEFIDACAFKGCNNLNTIRCESSQYMNNWHKNWNKISIFKAIKPIFN